MTETYYRRREGRRRVSSRKNERDRFYSRKVWLSLRAAILARHPFCADPFGEHTEQHRPVGATEVDHIVPRIARPDLELDERNLQPLCRRCHRRKTRQEQNRR